MSHHQRSSNLIFVIFIGLVSVLVLYLHAIYYYPFLSDDSLISLRYVERLLDGRGLTWTDGQPVEGYSNLLWMLLIASLGLLGIDLIDASRVLGFAGMSIVIFTLLYWYLYKNRTQKGYLPIALGLFFFCTAAPVAVWVIGGLEQPLYAALIALSIPLTVLIIESDNPRKKTLLKLSFILGLICITRPDGPLFCISAFLSIYIGRFISGRNVLSFYYLSIFASLPVLLYGGQLLFRLSYYGEFIPNPALVKIEFSHHHFIDGVKYILNGMWALFPFSLFAIIFIITSIFSPRKRSAGVSLLLISALWIPYIIFIGGDIFPAYRHFIPLIVVFAFALVEGTEWVLTRPQYLKHKAFLLGAIIIACTSYLNIQFTNSANKRAISERWEWDGKVVGLLLKQAFAEKQPLIAVTAAGCIPYWSELPALDMLGLNDYYLPRNPPKDIGKGLLAHEIGDGNYILQRQPDIIVFHTGNLIDMFRSGKEMQQTMEFYERYTPVKVRGRYPRDYIATLWFYKYSPKIGIQRTYLKIKVPGYLLNRNPNTITYTNNMGKMVVSIHSAQSASVVIDSVTSRNWNVEIKASRIEEISSELKQTDTSLVVTIFSKSDDPIEIEEIVLTRTEPTSEQAAPQDRCSVAFYSGR